MLLQQIESREKEDKKGTVLFYPGN